MPPSGLLPTLDPAVDEQAQVSVLKTLLATAQHFFGNFSGLSIRWRRCYGSTAPHVFASILMFVGRLGTRRQIGLLFRDNAPSASKFEALFEVARGPHGDTLGATFRRLQPAKWQAVVTGLTETLIRRKVAN